MGADAGWRCSEVVVDPLHDAAALLSLAQAQCGYDVPLAAAKYCEQARRRRCFRFEDEIVAIERHLDALRSGQFERFGDGHSRSLHVGRFSASRPEAVEPSESGACPSSRAGEDSKFTFDFARAAFPSETSRGCCKEERSAEFASHLSPALKPGVFGSPFKRLSGDANAS